MQAERITPRSPADPLSVRLYWHNVFFLWEESQNCLVGLVSSGHGEQCTPSLLLSFKYLKAIFKFHFHPSLEQKPPVLSDVFSPKKRCYSWPSNHSCCFSYRAIASCRYWNTDPGEEIVLHPRLCLVEGHVYYSHAASRSDDIAGSCWDCWYCICMLGTQQLLSSCMIRWSFKNKAISSKAVRKTESFVHRNTLLWKNNSQMRCYGAGDYIDEELRGSCCSDRGDQIFGVWQETA